MGKVPSFNPFIYGTVMPILQKRNAQADEERRYQDRIRRSMEAYQLMLPMEIQGEIQKRKAMSYYEATRPASPEEQASGNILSQLFKQEYPDIQVPPEQLGRLGKARSPLLQLIGKRSDAQARMDRADADREVRRLKDEATATHMKAQEALNQGRYEEVARHNQALEGQLADLRKAQADLAAANADYTRGAKTGRTEAGEAKLQAETTEIPLEGASKRGLRGEQALTEPAKRTELGARAGMEGQRGALYGAQAGDVAPAAADRRTRAGAAATTAGAAASRAGTAASRAGTYAAKNIDPSTSKPYPGAGGKPKDISMIMQRADRALHNRMGVDPFTQNLRRNPDYSRMMQDATASLMNNQDFDVVTTPGSSGFFGLGATPDKHRVVPRPMPTTPGGTPASGPGPAPSRPATYEEIQQSMGQ